MSIFVYTNLKKFIQLGYKVNSHFTKPASKLCGYHKIVRRSSHFRHKYSQTVEAAVNQQIQAEQQAAQDYLNMAVVFRHPCSSRPGAGGYFMKMYEEELGHMQDLIQFQLTRGGMPLIDGLKAPNLNLNLTLLEAFQKALKMEKFVTELLESLVLAAEIAKDYQCSDYVTSLFLTQQMDSINEISHHVAKLSRLPDEHAIYHYDLELAKSYPYLYKSRSP